MPIAHLLGRLASSTEANNKIRRGVAATTTQSVVNGVTESAKIVSDYMEGMQNHTAQKQETIDNLLDQMER